MVRLFSSAKKSSTPSPGNALFRLKCSLMREGIAYVIDPPSQEDHFPDPMNFGTQLALAALLSQLEEEGFAQWRVGEVWLAWSALYELADSPSYQESLVWLGLPPIEAWRPELASRGSLTDTHFSILLTGWRDPNDQLVPGNAQLTGAQLEIRGLKVLLPKAAWETVEALAAFHQRPTELRTTETNRLAWARIRRSAILSGAGLSDFLKNTIVLTPERLQIQLRKVQFGESKTVEVIPSFDEAPARWLEFFDRFPIQDRYEVPDGQGMVHLVPSPEVRTVLQEIKKMPGRRVSGERAEAFLRNPYATLGPDAGVAIDPVQFEQARDAAGIAYAWFTAQVNRDGDGFPVSVALLVEESIRGEIRSETLRFEGSAPLEKFVTKLEEKIQRGVSCCVWEGYELEIQGNTPDQLAMLQAALQDLQRGPTVWEIFDPSHYSERIEGIGVEKPYYSPFIARKSRDEWIPGDDITFGIAYTPEDASEPTNVAFTEKTFNNFQDKLRQAKKDDRQKFDFPDHPQPWDVADAQKIVDILQEAINPVPGPKGNGPDVERKKRMGLVVKPNVEQLDYAERRGTLLHPQNNQPRLPGALKRDSQLKDHQREGLAWLQHLWSKSPDNCRGAVLADDMGLGKTLQLLSFIVGCLEDQPDLDPFLVVAPVSLLENWCEEVEKFFQPDALPILTLYGKTLADKRLPKEKIDNALMDKGVEILLRRDWLGNAKLVLTTYETLRDLEFSLARQKWSVVICDEAQKIKNPNAMVTRAAKKQNARLKIACTGTPVENTLADLWCLFDFVQPGLLGALNAFAVHYRRPIETESDAERARVEELRAIIQPQLMRRVKKDVAKDLPAKILVESCRSLSLSARQRILYAQAVGEFRHRSAEDGANSRLQHHFGLLQYLRRLCSDPRPPGQLATNTESVDDITRHSPKMAWLLAEMVKIRDRGDKAIVFCELRDLQRTLQRSIAQNLGFTPDIINGDASTSVQSATSRQKRLAAFQKREGFGVIILSPLAVGFGVNIQAANHVIHFTRTWNPAKEDQATDRAYRIGQQKTVYVYCPVVVAEDFTTFDVKLDRLLASKRSLADDMLNGTGNLSPADFGDLDDVEGSNVFSQSTVSSVEIGSMDPDCFEIFCMLLWKAHGYSHVYRTPQSGDGGIDVVALQGNSGVLIQCKTSSNERQELGWDAVKDVVAGSAMYESRHRDVAFKRLAVTNQRFNERAHDQARVNQVELVEHDGLVKMLMKKPVKREDLDRILFTTLDAAGG